MGRIIVCTAVMAAFMFGCCCHKQCVKDHSAEKSKIEAKKAMNELDAEKSKENNQ
jgi:hypothetical protein